jgi:hypothetical protein
MDHGPLSPLADWQNFYVIVGSSAGALTGLQFVVMTLMVQARAAGSPRDIRAFGTPTVTHFCAALLLSVLTVAPWRTVTGFAACLAACGALGFLYSLSIIWHSRKASYRPDVEDTLWYVALPFLAHLSLLLAPLLLWWDPGRLLPVIAVDTLVFLLLGVHNSWDTVTYIALQHTDSRKAPGSSNSE